MTRVLEIGEWVVPLGLNEAYVNISEFARLNDMFVTNWFSLKSTKNILKYLEDMGLNPTYVEDEDVNIRIEILSLLLTPEFSSGWTPDLREDIVSLTLDWLLSKTRERMGMDFFDISYLDTTRVAVMKSDICRAKYMHAQRRLAGVTIAENLMRSIQKLNGGFFTESQKNRVKTCLQETSELVPEVIDIIREIPNYRVITGAKKIIRWLKHQDVAMINIYYKILDLKIAVQIETQIKATNYRSLLAQLMIHHTMRIPRT
jgi:hypothetical protein